MGGSERFFHAAPAAMTELREFGLLRGNFEQGAARAYNGASEHLYKHPWCAQPHATSILFLPRFIRKLFENHGVADCDNFMDLAPMQALAVRCQFPFSGRLAPACALVAPARLPVQPFLPLLLDAALCIVVARISRAPLPVHPALQSTDALFVGGRFLAEHGKAGFCCSWHEGDGRGTQV